MDLGKYVDDYQGNAQSSSVELPANKTIRLPDQPCKFAMLSNWNTGDDSAFTAKVGGGGSLIEDQALEFYYGFGDTLVAQLFQSKNTEIFPISNLNQIIVRARPGSTGRVYFTWFQ